MNQAFLDTGYLIALESVNDQYHKRAKNHWQEYLQTNPLLITSTYVFDEIITFFNSRNHHSKAVNIGKSLILSSSIELIYVDEKLFKAGWKYFRQYQDKRYSFTDCISFLLMEENGIQKALTFDQHFEQAGFRILPS